ncbi:MAG: TetR/AcrR family transcriptional regulator [Saprospiraceae bacterium]|nr:TetR/AcrR family transcriptional regulator [Saprospiraceae bacterium]
MDKTKEIINKKAIQVFLKYGFRAVTMDDLCKELTISKKTLYRYFSNKEELLKECIHSFQKSKINQADQIIKKAADPIEKIFLVIKSHLDYRDINHVTGFWDLQKYYYDIWNDVVCFNKSYIHNMMIKNMEEGIAAGLYREDLNTEIIAKLFNHRSLILSDSGNVLFENYSTKEVIKELITYHLNGICTDKGRKLMNEYLDNYFKS